MQMIKNSVKDCKTVHYRELKVIQGDLKTLTKDNYQKLKKQLKETGITSPCHVWVDKDGQLNLIDGTQRRRTYEAMENEGFSIPLVPYVEIDAPDLRSAKQILLSLISQYGELNKEELVEFSYDLFSIKELDDTFRFPEIDFKKLDSMYNEDSSDKEKTKKEVECPECGALFHK